MGLSNERGSVVVLVAVMLFLIFFCVALVVDIGHIHNVKIELQRAADAAALAGAQQIPDGTIVDTAGAMVRANGVDKQVDNDKVITDVKPGCWDTQITLGKTAFDRFTTPADPKCTTINAVKVTATLDVPHFFAFPVEPTKVTADAIAVAQTINPVLPFAMLSCTTSTATGDNWALPDMTFIGIKTYEFANQDTSAWTTLTFSPANATKIKELIVDPDKLNEYNSVIYGKNLESNLDNDGIENTDVAPGVYPYNSGYEGCQPVGTDIPCGLGRIADKEIAAPDEFPAPPNLVNLNPVSGEYKATSFDPLTDFGRWKDASGVRKPGALPRWYNLNNEKELQSDDYFARVLTQDGILLNSTKLEDGTYANGGDTPFGDNRFRPSSGSSGVADGGDLLQCNSQGKNCQPDYSKVLERAGYPQVYLTNGVATDILHKFLEKIGAQDGAMSCSADDALPDTQRALILKTPVIFVGDCDTWTPNPSNKFFYVGLAKFLVTRIWVNNEGFDCPGCDLQAEGVPGPSRIEGLQILPVADDEDPNASLISIFLVE